MDTEVEAYETTGVLREDALTDDITIIIDDIASDPEGADTTGMNATNGNSEASEPEPMGVPESETTGVLDPETAGVTTEAITIDDEDSDEDEGVKETSEDDSYHPNNMTPSVKRTYGIRTRKPRDFSHSHTYLV
jgi:hypothetical protein